jgi:hypothetical protein
MEQQPFAIWMSQKRHAGATSVSIKTIFVRPMQSFRRFVFHSDGSTEFDEGSRRREIHRFLFGFRAASMEFPVKPDGLGMGFHFPLTDFMILGKKEGAKK